MSDPRRTLRVLVVDDSPVARRLIVQILSSDPELRVIAEAQNGDEAVRLAIRDSPDVIVMDIVMPSMDGLEATRRIMEVAPTPILLVSATYDGRDLSKSFQALEAGALTLAVKPRGPRASTFESEAAALAVTVKLMADVKLVRRRPAGASDPPALPRASVRARSESVEIIAVAGSTGGPAAIATILTALPASTPVPIVLVQHITAGFHQGLVEWLDRVAPLSVRLARDRMPLRAGEVLVAPPGAHLGVSRGARVALSRDPPISGHRPSATHLFRSVASAYGASAVGAILTGMGEDGVAGLRMLKQAGGLVLAQDEATSVVYGMPRKAVSLGIVDDVLPIDQMAGALIAAWNGKTP
jgi:two-component system, chemotaxis family, protein-glutamate methylesterase/glutaminase